MGFPMNGIDLFREECRAISAEFPNLVYNEEQGLPVISGKILLKEQDMFIDAYEVRIIPTLDYPNRFPLVFETAGRLPHNIEWHVFPDGHCCIKSYPEEIYMCRQGLSLQDFIGGQLVPYFFNQKYRELNGFFLQERKHGDAGSLQFFEDIFHTSDLRIIGRGLLSLWENGLPNRVSECFCGSGKKYRKCHKEALLKMSVFSRSDLEMFLSIIKNQFRFQTMLT
jgi:hypothetical protein